jgi:predicted nucleic acid-binding Zn ribbon protein
MIYQFRCPLCGNYKEVVRHHTECQQEEICGNNCNMVMERVYSVPQIAVSTLGYYDHGLGAYIGSKKDIANAKSRIRSETGSDMIEVGNEKFKKTPKLNNYDFPRGVFDNAIRE